MATLQDLSVDEVKTCLDVEASASVGQVDIDTAYRHCKESKDKKLSAHSFANSFTDRFVLWFGRMWFKTDTELSAKLFVKND